MNCLIPNSIYTVRADCNAIRFVMMGGATYTMHMTPGFYGAGLFVSAL